MGKQYQAVDYMTEKQKSEQVCGRHWKYARECEHHHRRRETAQKCAKKNGFQGIEEIDE